MIDSLFTDDEFLTARVKLKQRKSGHRVGSDAVLLAATMPPDAKGLVMDAGSSSGAVGLMAAWRAPEIRVRLVDIDRDDLLLADENIKANAMQDRVTTHEGDILASHHERVALKLCEEDADYVLSNPPYLDEARVRISDDADRIRAHVMPEGGLEKWILGCLQMLTSDGILTFIHRADHLDALLHLMQGRFGDLAILPIYPRESFAATRILISGKRNSRAPIRILPGLVLHMAEGGFTPCAAAIHAGNAALFMR